MTDSHRITDGWTIDTALDHVLAIVQQKDATYSMHFEAIEKATAAALSAADRAVLKAEAAAEKRFEGVNEFRNTLSDQQRNLMPRAEVEVIMRGLTDKIGALEKQLDTVMGEKRGIQNGWGYAIGAAGLVLTLVTLVMLFNRVPGSP